MFFGKEVYMLRAYGELITSPIFMLYIATVITDVFIGNIKAFVYEDFNSDVGIKGSLKHAGLMVFILFVIPNVMMYFDIGSEISVVILYFVYQYLMSIIENLGELGFNIPKRWLKKFRLFDENGEPLRKRKGEK